MSHIQVHLPGLGLTNSSSNVHPSVLGSAGCLSFPHLTLCIFVPTGYYLQCLSQRHYFPLLRDNPSGSSVSLVTEVLGNATSLQVQEGQYLHLVCETDGNPPAKLSWSRGSLTLSPSKPLDPGILELPQVVLSDGGEFICRAQHPRVSYSISLNLVVQGEY